jgi:prevent-host-death family protein
MQKVIGVTELRRHFKAVFDEVAQENVPYVLTRGSRPEAAMISYEDFLKSQALQEEGILARFDALTERMAERNVEFTDEDVMELESERSHD